MSNNSDRFEKMLAMHKARRQRQAELSAQGVDFIAESRAGAIGRLVNDMIKNNGLDIPLIDQSAESERHNAKDDQSD